MTTTRASFAQERLYFVNELEPGNPAYVVAFALRIEGPLRTEALAGALRRVVARHDALRTSYAVSGGVLTQRVAPEPVLEPDVRTEPWVDVAQQDEILRELVATQARRPFVLTTGPVLRAWIRSWDADTHALVVLVHHIACDGWSVGLLLADLAAEYNGTGPTEPAESYPAYARDQRARWADDTAGLAFWRAELAGAPQLALPTDFPRPGVLSCRGAVLRRPVGRDLIEALTGWARRHGSTLFGVALAGYAAVLARYTRQHDVVIGVPVANRMDEVEERLVGCLVNTLPIRVDLSGEPTFAELVTRVRRTSMTAFAHQEVPFEEIVRATAGGRQLSHAPLFQTSLTVQNFPFAFPELTGVKVTEVDVEIDATKFDLGITLDVSTDKPFLRAEFSTELFDPATAATLLDHYLTFLESIVDDEGQEPDPVDPDERRRLTSGVNPPARPVRHPSVLERFAGHAEATPDAVAIRFRDRNLSYAELDRWSDRIAAGLADAGIARGDRVGLLLRRSPAVVAAILGVWKAGGSYVPLDPEYPRQRLELIAESAAAPVLLVEPDTAQLAGTLPAARLIDVTTITGDSVVPQRFPDPDELAYIIYTSGSTGVPKGVMVGHDGLDALCAPSPAGLDITSGDTWLGAHSFSFDVSVWEMWGALTTGGRLVIAEHADLVDPDRLARLVLAERITVLSQTPGSLYRMLPRYLELAGDSPLRYVVLAGEALSWSRLAAMVAGHGGMRAVFVNMYGITEGTIHVTIHQVPTDALTEVREGNIGVALPSGRCYVLDERRRPVGVAMPGELYVGGSLVAKGYLNNPELTVERFLPDPWGPGVMYRTGDLARWGTDGNLIYLGRNDTQVKIRGYRVECAEVEGTLLAHPGVQACAVAADGEQLVAFVTGNPGPDAERELRAMATAMLPGYMVPSRILVVPAIPLTAHGKVDTARLLAESTAARATAPVSLIRGRASSMAEHIRRLWTEVLNRPDVGLHDNFFDLGGHSFALITLQQRMAEEGLDISVTDLFRFGTVAACAAHFERTAPRVADDHLEQRRTGRALLAERRKGAR
ncbi:MAG TPA: amino acid adenylation domain-containing protein [Actinophytocola sp.]|uniref:non-ribosomal peptide synthetase n=1 Tax=Actinophytocola sp. TaxID=1872138 RepID=UPI002DBF524B|nr:amino acid adenylation domain-containing protein [Actinophytocola sp.]HEU5473428.1 amino acid adenylation domain-containing protein [Actinophytocola sp.]